MGCGVYKMNSWDCFDTLVSRRYLDPKTVFDEVGKRLGIENFRKIRVQAEKNSNKSYAGIYKNLSNIDPSVEFQVELEHCFGIVENINKVQDGDIIVSDMYLTENQIRQILISCGLKKDVKIYVTPDGKHKGYIWNNLPTINIHTGDNFRSDVESPTKFGIKANHYTGYKFNGIEEYVSKSDYSLACWMRYVRLQCPYLGKEKNFWDDQANLNLPVLALATLELPADKKIAFTYRDSVYWHPLYEAMTGRKGKELNVSRHCYNNPSPEFSHYVLEQTKDSVIVDLQGSGRSIKTFFKDKLPEVIYVCGFVEEPFQCMERKGAGDAIERHNCSSIGALVDWDANGPIRRDCENDLTVVEVQAAAMDLAIKSAPLFSIKKNRDLLAELLWKMRKNFTWKNVNWESSHS